MRFNASNGIVGGMDVNRTCGAPAPSRRLLGSAAASELLYSGSRPQRCRHIADNRYNGACRRYSDLQTTSEQRTTISILWFSLVAGEASVPHILCADERLTFVPSNLY